MLAQTGQFYILACSRTKFGPEHWDPWKCFDLTYIFHFLTDGYGLPTGKSIHVKNNIDSENSKPQKEKKRKIVIFFQITQKIDGNEASWSLGAAFHLLHTYRNSTESISLFSKGCPLLHSFCDSVYKSVTLLWKSLLTLLYFPYAA